MLQNLPFKNGAFFLMKKKIFSSNLQFYKKVTLIQKVQFYDKIHHFTKICCVSKSSISFFYFKILLKNIVLFGQKKFQGVVPTLEILCCDVFRWTTLVDL